MLSYHVTYITWIDPPSPGPRKIVSQRKSELDKSRYSEDELYLVQLFVAPSALSVCFSFCTTSVTMAIPSQAAARCCRYVVRPSTSSLRISSSSSTYLSQRRTTPARRWQSTEAAAGAQASTNPKITQIVDQISQLTLLETADLVASLKVRNSFKIAVEVEILRRNGGIQAMQLLTFYVFDCSPA